MSVELILVRHGQTTANAAGLLSGRVDVGLSDEGSRQIERVAEELAASRIDEVITSPLSRAMSTADAVARRVDRSPRVDDRVVELNYGDWDGRPLSDIGSDIWNAWRRDIHFRPPGGETLAEVGERVRRALSEWVDEWSDRGGRLVVVSHVSPIKALTCAVLGLPDEFGWKLFLSPASITRLRVDRSGGQLLGFNETISPVA